MFQRLSSQFYSFRLRRRAFFKFLFPKIKTNSIKFEISILYTVILGIILIIFSGVLYIIISSTLYRELDLELKQKTQAISQTIRTYLDTHKEDPEALMFAVDTTIANEGKQQNRWWFTGFERRWLARVDELDLRGSFINFVSPDGKSLSRSKNMPDDLLEIFLKNIQFVRGKEESLRTISYKQRNIQIMNVPFSYEEWDNYILQIGILSNPTAQLLRNWLWSIVISIPIVLLFTSFVGRLFAQRILGPIQEIATTAQKITHEDLSSRVKAKQFAVEMRYLVEAFNNMIARLEGSFNHIEEFSSHVAHELKTPLAVIKGEVELALRKERDETEYKRVLKSNLEEVDRVLKIIEDLLLATKLDYQTSGVFNFELFDLNEFFHEVHEQSGILAVNKAIRVNMDMPQSHVMARADRVHLKRLFLNLISNALKFTPNGGRIDIMVKHKNRKVIVAIRDSGIGISEEDLPKVFEKFFRAGKSKPGNGLGLNIARSIAEIHKGRIEVASVLHEGSTFTVILPIVEL